MSGKVHVHVVHYRDCKNLSLRYTDPQTGKHVRKSAGTASRSEARRAAHAWEADLNAGRDKGRLATTWEQFRQRYEELAVPGFADQTGQKVGTMFNAVERILPKVAAGKLTDLTPQAISTWQQQLRSENLSENTIASYSAHLRAALAWAVDQEMLAAIPKVKRPQRAQKRGGGSKGKGRPLATEEFERMLAVVPRALEAHAKRKRDYRPKPEKRGPYNTQGPQPLDSEAVESWRHYFRGLWLSGLRLSESLELFWDRPDRLCIDLSGKYPMLRIPAELEKGNRDRLLPLFPDFCEFLLATPEEEQHGRVFRPMMPGGGAGYDVAGRVVALCGKLAGVKVHVYPKTGKVKFASAHDLRRSCLSRWAKVLMPAVLQELARHEAIDTTMGYYVGLTAGGVADQVWAAYRGQEGTVLGTVHQNDPRNGVTESEAGIAVSNGNTSGFDER